MGRQTVALKREVCCHGKHVYRVDVFSKVEKQGTSSITRKDRRQTGAEVSVAGACPGLVAVFVFALSHI